MRLQIAISACLLYIFIAIACNNQKSKENDPAASSKIQSILNEDIGDSSAFKMAIIKSISIPFTTHFDTLIITHDWWVCGMNSKSFIESFFNPNLSNSFVDTLSRQMNIKVITDSVFEKFMDAQLQEKFKGVYPESLFDSCLGDNITVNLVARKLNDTSFQIMATYRTIDTSIRIDNIFVKRENKWTSKRINPTRFN